MEGTSKQDVVAQIVGDLGRYRAGAAVTAFAPSNIALCKYWGKRDEELNLPITSSLSLSLGRLGSEVRLAVCDGETDDIALNDEPVAAEHPFARRLSAYLDLFRPDPALRYEIDARNTVPTAAGFASSASGFAAMVRALDALWGWQLEARGLSILARLGSGSACRSIHAGLVEWHAGVAEDGMDSFAEPLADQWPELRIGLLILSAAEKGIGSRPAMRYTRDSSPLYDTWPQTVADDLDDLKQAIRERDFDALGRTTEANAMSMHATMISARPSILYWVPETVKTLHRVRLARDRGLCLYATMDAGPNVKLLFLERDEEDVRGVFPEVLVTSAFEGGAGEAE